MIFFFPGSAVNQKHYPCRTTAHALGVITALLELLNSEYPVIQQLTLETLQSVTTDRDSRDQFREEQGFEKIMDILNDSVSVCVCKTQGK